MKICVLGAGSWGIALTRLLDLNGHEVTVWSIDPEEVSMLKEYSQQPYRYGIGSLGDDGGVMTPDKLGEIIGEYIKHKIQPIKNYKEKFIEIMTPNQKAFVDFAVSWMIKNRT